MRPKKIIFILLFQVGFGLVMLGAQSGLSRLVISNGGKETTGDKFKANLTIGQSLAGLSRGISTQASIGFWYVSRDPGPGTQKAKIPVAIERRIPSGTHGSIYELQRHTHAEKVNFLKIYPNPVVSRASLEFQLADDGDVHLALFDFKGKRVSTVIRRKMEAGRYKMELIADQLPGAVYSLVLMTGRFRIQEKFMVMN